MAAPRDGKPTYPDFEARKGAEPRLEKGCVQVYSGGGKGKSTAAFGLIARASGHGLKCRLIQFMKKGDYGEIVSLKRLPGVSIEQYGSGHWVNKRKPAEEDLRLAHQALESGESAASSGAWDLVVLDEVNVALVRRLITLEEVLHLLDSKAPRTELVLTGRGAQKALMERADYVTMMVGMKHPYHRGIKARKGIEW